MPAVRAGANAEGTTPLRRSRPGFLGLNAIVVLVFMLAFYAFFVAAAPLLVLRFRSLISYLISPFSLWAFALIMLNITHLLDALIDGDQHG